MTQPRIALALLLAPFSTPIFIIVFFSVISWSWPFHYDLWIWVWGSTLVSYAGLLLMGIPIIYLLNRWSMLNLPLLTLCGAMAGMLVFWLFAFCIALLLGSHSAFELKNAISGAVLGALIAIAFGLIAGIGVKETRPLRIGHVGR